MTAGRRALFTAAVAACLGLGAGAAPGAGPAAEARPTPLVLVSFDGFRWDYPQHAPTPGLDRLAAAGIAAEHLVPVFPSKTFPAHYSIVTGLYPGHHGILSNNMRDPRWPEPFGLGSRDQVQDARWWGGEPIWVTAQRQGLSAAVYFWPGSEAPVGGMYADRWFPYEESVPYEERVDRVVGWLAAEAQRPNLVALYFDEPNTTGHGTGPLSATTLEAVRRVDTMLVRLLDGLAAAGVAANVIVVSDHGMARNAESRVIYLEDYVKLAPNEVFEFGAMLQLYPLPGRERQVYEALAGAHPNLRVWRRDGIPARLHTAGSPRLAPIVGSPDAGWEVVPSRGPGPPIAGDHGQDPLHPDMHGIFRAAGPDLRAGVVLPAIEQVDLYELMARLLRIEPAPNDGDPARIAGLLARR